MFLALRLLIVEGWPSLKTEKMIKKTANGRKQHNNTIYVQYNNVVTVIYVQYNNSNFTCQEENKKIKKFPANHHQPNY